MGKQSRAKKAARELVAADMAITHAAAEHWRAPAARLAGWMAGVADQPPLIALSIGTGLVGLATGRRDLARGGARMLAAHLLATGIKTLVKRGVDRTRPKKALDSGRARFEPGDSDDHEQTSFPSGHTAGAVAVARAAAHEIEGTAAAGALATAAIAAAQPVAGNHYIGDVAAGGAIGWAAEAIVGAAFERWEWGREEQKAKLASPQP